MTFTAAEQKKHREAFIHECRQKAWGAACHADWIVKSLDELLASYQKLQADDRRMEDEIKELEAAVDSHMRDNREKRKAIQERRNALAQQMQLIGQNIQRGQKGLNDLYQSAEANLQLATHAEKWAWKEVDATVLKAEN
jgi:chromosome segregation ATPase